MDKRESAIYASNYILESSGIACGDKISILGFEEGEGLFFSYICDSCSLCTRMAKHLERCLSGHSRAEISSEIKRLSMMRDLNVSEKWLETIPDNRKDCVYSPINLLKKLLISVQSESDSEFHSDHFLACDACVRSIRVNWTTANCDSGIKSNGKVCSSMLDDENERFLQQCGLAGNGSFILDNITSFQKISGFENNKLIKKLRLAAPIFNNLIGINRTEINPFIKRTVFAQHTSLLMAQTEIDKINYFIINSKLKIAPVKGQRAKLNYPPTHFRVHMDFDYLAASENDAFYLLNHLLNNMGFRFVLGGSVPFSFKAISEMNHEMLTGHVHLEKILQDQYQVVVDINIGAFPIGRVGAIKCNNQGRISVEDEICITLAHLFKHEYAYIKDINDLFYYFHAHHYREDLLQKKIKQHHLELELSAFLRFMNKRYSTSILPPISLDDSVLKQCHFEQWPFSRQSHFLLKKYFLKEACIYKFGRQDGEIEVESQLQNLGGRVECQKYITLCPHLNSRSYLYPIVIFRRLINLAEHKNELINDSFFIYKHIAVLPIGLFLLEKDGRNVISRDEMMQEVNEIMLKMNLKEDLFRFDYAMRAREDLWLY